MRRELSARAHLRLHAHRRPVIDLKHDMQPRADQVLNRRLLDNVPRRVRNALEVNRIMTEINQASDPIACS